MWRWSLARARRASSRSSFDAFGRSETASNPHSLSSRRKTGLRNRRYRTDAARRACAFGSVSEARTFSPTPSYRVFPRYVEAVYTLAGGISFSRRTPRSARAFKYPARNNRWNLYPISVRSFASALIERSFARTEETTRSLRFRSGTNKGEAPPQRAGNRTDNK